MTDTPHPRASISPSRSFLCLPVLFYFSLCFIVLVDSVHSSILVFHIWTYFPHIQFSFISTLSFFNICIHSWLSSRRSPSFTLKFVLFLFIYIFLFSTFFLEVHYHLPFFLALPFPFPLSLPPNIFSFSFSLLYVLITFHYILRFL